MENFANDKSEINNTDIMFHQILDEINNHDNCILSICRSKINGDLSNKVYQEELEFERRKLSKSIKKIIDGDFDWVY